MCSTPWSASASITISAPVISRPVAPVPGLLVVIIRSVTPGPHLIAVGIKKGPVSPLPAHRRIVDGLATPGGAPANYQSNFIAHFDQQSPFRCAFLYALRRTGSSDIRVVRCQTSSESPHPDKYPERTPNEQRRPDRRHPESGRYRARLWYPERQRAPPDGGNAPWRSGIRTDGA